MTFGFRPGRRTEKRTQHASLVYYEDVHAMEEHLTSRDCDRYRDLVTAHVSGGNLSALSL